MKKIIILMLLFSVGTIYAQNTKVLDLRSVDHTFRIVDNSSDDLDVTTIYTYEVWVYVEGYSAYDRIAYRANVFTLFLLTGDNPDNYKVRFVSYDSNGSTVKTLTTDDITVKKWHHIAVSSDGTNTRIFVDGNQKASSAVITLRTETTSLSIASRWYNSKYDKFLNGAVDEFRLSNSARYTSSFIITRETAPYTDDTNTIVLFHFDDAAVPPTNSSSKTFTLYNTPNAIVSGDYKAWDDVSFSETLPFPVELTSFTASKNGDVVILNWETATEVNNYGFAVERASSRQVGTTPVKAWEEIGFVEGHGNSNVINSYSFVDNSAKGDVSYRLKQIDIDGNFEYSDVVQVTANLAFKLLQNHPNPFNPATQISFTLPEVAKVSITVYNALGQKVTELTNKEYAAGTHSVNFDASGLTSGIYFYRLNSPNYSATKKMLLVK